jgi:hypothetical protein
VAAARARERQLRFQLIREDLAFLNAHGKKLWIQYQDVTFNPNRINVPKYLLDDPKYNGGADKQYQIKGDDEAQAVHEGWMARRYDPAVQERLHKLYAALGKEFDGELWESTTRRHRQALVDWQAFSERLYARDSIAMRSLRI